MGDAIRAPANDHRQTGGKIDTRRNSQHRRTTTLFFIGKKKGGYGKGRTYHSHQQTTPGETTGHYTPGCCEYITTEAGK